MHFEIILRASVYLHVLLSAVVDACMMSKSSNSVFISQQLYMNKNDMLNERRRRRRRRSLLISSTLFSSIYHFVHPVERNLYFCQT